MSLQTLFNLYKLKRDARLKRYEIRKMQIRKLRRIVEHAYRNVPFYHRKFKSGNIKPYDIKTFEDLAKIPVTTKFELQATDLHELVSKNVEVSKCLKRTTSGSTGIPLTIILSKEVLELERALFARAYFETGLKLWDRMVRITDPRNFPQRQSWHQRLGIVRTKHISVFDEVEKQLSIIEKYKPDVIRGYTSCVELLARFCKEHGKHIRPRLIFTTAELLGKETRQLINSVFQARLFDLYISEEFSLMAWECREHVGYHINAESLFLEIVKNDEVVGPDERGEIICTSLINKVMPLIRYNIGDVGATLNERCPCGITLPLIQIIEGRTGDFLVTPNGKIISPTVFFPYPFEDPTWIKQFRIIQESKEKMIFQIAIKDGFKCNEDALKKAQGKIRQLFGEDMEVNFQLVKEIRRDPSGKLRKVISHVPVDTL